MYTLKQTPQDFIVEEVIDLSYVAPNQDRKFLIYKLTKVNETTIFSLRKIARKLDIDDKMIGFCGLKDKNATTSQYISIPNLSIKTSQGRVEGCSSENTKLELVGSCDRALFIGSLLANKFTINVSNIEGYEIAQKSSMINYFGEQRFSGRNAEIGKLLITKKFLDALKIIIDETISKNDQVIEEVKKYHLENPNDGVGALRRLSPQLRSIYVHAFQSLMWNQIASDIVKNKSEFFVDEELQINIPSKQLPSDIQLPLIGFDLEDDDCPAEITTLIKQKLKEQSLTLRDFINKEFPEITKAGGKRSLIAPIGDLQIKNQTDNQATFTFTLDKGSYATIALRHLLIPKTKTI